MRLCEVCKKHNKETPATTMSGGKWVCDRHVTD